MRCRKCNKELDNNTGICPFCAQANDIINDSIFETGKKHKKRNSIIIIAVCALIVIAAAIFAIITLGTPNTDTAGERLAAGDAYMLSKDYEKAAFEYQKAAELDPMSENAYISLAEVYIESGDNEAAIMVLKSAIEKINSATLNNMLVILESEQTDSGDVSDSALIETGTQVGQQFPNIELTLADESTVMLHDLFEEGKLLYLDIFTTSCRYCRQMIPDIKAFMADNGDSAVYLLMGIGETVSQLNDYINNNELEAVKAGIYSSLRIGDYRINSVPDVFLLDENGVVLEHPLIKVDKQWMEEVLSLYAK